MRGSKESLKPYLAYSTAGHAVLLVLLSITIRNGLPRQEEIYRIHFIGATSGILNRSQEESKATEIKAAPVSRPPPLTDPDAFNLSRRKSKPLPRPSILTSPLQEAKSPKSTETSVPSQPQTPGGASGGPSISADMPNFPYPWYISLVRTALWDRWSGRMLPMGGECVVVFSILRNGGIVDLRVESSSGDESQDYAAVSSVQEAAPFPPLPRDFEEPFLKVHVQFRSR